MKPLNQPERRTRLWQFALLYLLALLVPLVASYYFFSNSSLADENARLKQTLARTNEEQGRLVMRFDTLTQFLRRIERTDQQIIAETNPNVRSVMVLRNRDYGDALAVRLSELRNDTSQLQVVAHRRLVRDMLLDFDFFRSSRNTIDQLREEVARFGAGAEGMARMSAELASCRQEVSSTKQQVVTLQAALAAGGGRPEPSRPPVSQPGPNGSNRVQIELLRDQLAFAEADCIRQRAVERKPRSKERRQLLESSRTAFIQIMQDPATDALRQSIEQTLAPINVELGREPRFFGILGSQ